MHEVFAQAHAEARPVVIAYLPVGYPDVPTSLQAFAALATSGIDMIEVGVPYSDPLMDGPVIEAAVGQALSNGVRVDHVFEAVSTIAQYDCVPLVMSYWNLIDRRGVEAFATSLSQAGGQGVITPDLTPDEAGAWTAATDRADVKRIYLVAPSSTDERLAMTSAACTGFVYAASTMGVTGTRHSVGAAARTLVERTKAVSQVPVCVGLGISTPEQVREVGQYADGAIIGSALVKALGEGGVSAMSALAARLATKEVSASGA